MTFFQTLLKTQYADEYKVESNKEEEERAENDARMIASFDPLFWTNNLHPRTDGQ